MEKKCLLIDNEDQSTSIETIEREARRNGLTVICKQFNVGSTQRDDLLSEGRIDMGKVKSIFTSEFSNEKFDLIAFDWQLDDDDINGIELIRQFDHNGIRKNTPKLLYSGLLQQVIESILEDYKNGNIDTKYAWNQINTLIRINIIDYVDRSSYEKSIIDVLGKLGDPIEAILEKKLREYHNLTFRNTYPMFEGKTLSEIADIIEKDASQGNKFKNELIEQALAYLIHLNND